MHRIPRWARAIALAIACAALVATFTGSALATDEPSLGVGTTTTTLQTCGPDGCGDLSCTLAPEPATVVASVTSPDPSAPLTRSSSSPADTATALALAPKKVKTCITVTVAFTAGPLNARRPFVQGFTPMDKDLIFAEFDRQGRTAVAVRFKPGAGVSLGDCTAPGAQLTDQNARVLNAASPKNLQFFFNAGRNETIGFGDNHGYQRFTVSLTCDLPE
jgi:hypothetical protein